MPREDERSRRPERGYRRETRGRYSSESARRSVRGDEDDERETYEASDYDEEQRSRSGGERERYGREREQDREFRQDERGRYQVSGRRDQSGYGSEWPESYRSDFSGRSPERYRDSWSERQSGPYRSPVTGRPVSEDEYRQEAHWHRSRPHTGFSGRVSEFGYEDPTWAVPQMGRTGGATQTRYAPPGAGFRGVGPRKYSRSDERIHDDICDELSDDGEVDARDVEIEVKDGTVTLSGTVPERYMKHRAEDIADSCRGVRDLENRIRVQRAESGQGRPGSEQGPSGEERTASGKASSRKRT